MKKPVIYFLCTGNSCRSQMAEGWAKQPPRVQRIHWGLQDPAKAMGTEAEIEAKFNEVRDDIRDRVQRFLSEISK